MAACPHKGGETGGQMRLAETVTFGGGGLNRAHDRRGPDRPGADDRVLPLWKGKVATLAEAGDRHRLLRVAPDDPALALAVEWVFLGLADDGTALWAADISPWAPPAEATGSPAGFFDAAAVRHHGLPGAALVELRWAMTRLTAHDAELAATARALLGWHQTHRFCACCGAPSAAAKSGWQRDCAACGAHHFPRTDPVVIMLITDGEEVLLGRSPGWPPGMYSLLAGFVEPGETVEGAVRREVWEEAGVRVAEVSYLASQPWPFPASLMLGCRGRAASRTIRLDPAELEDALWVSRARLLTILAGQDSAILPPRQGAIAGFLLHNWLADRLD
jgi:NAD+ diphosphatase